MNRKLLEETLDTIRESIGYKVEQIEGLTQSLRIIYEEEKKPKTYGNEIAIQAIIDSIDDAANDTLFLRVHGMPNSSSKHAVWILKMI